MSAKVLDLDDLKAETTNGLTEVRKRQREDPNIGPILQQVSQGVQPTLGKLTPGSSRHRLAKEFDKLKLKRGLLYRLTTVDGQEHFQVVMPKVYRELILTSLHDNAGHQGRDKTLSLVRDRFCWPGMAADIETKVGKSDRCSKRRASTYVKAPLVNIRSSQPLELVCMDYLTLEQSNVGFQHILVVTDHFTRYAQAVPTKDQTAKTTAEALINVFIVHDGVPHKLHNDQGANFDGKLIHELCRLMGSTKSRTSPYHPAGNGMCERFNRTLMNMLGKLDLDQKTNCKSHVGPMVHACNATRHCSTGQAPFSLMFGRQPRLLIDLIFDLPEKGQTYGKYIAGLRDCLKAAYDLATREAEKSVKAERVI